MLRKLGRSNFEIGHTGTRKEQREDALAKSIGVDREASKAALDYLWVDGIK